MDGMVPNTNARTKSNGKTLGLIGFGRIAQAMAKKAHHGFDMKILFTRLHSQPRASSMIYKPLTVKLLKNYWLKPTLSHCTARRRCNPAFNQRTAPETDASFGSFNQYCAWRCY